MELELTRSAKTNRSTIRELTVNGSFECFILEDKDRGLRQGMPVSELMALKIKNETAIPTGRYELVVSFSERFQKKLPLLLDVPVFEGIRIHSGNTEVNTSGCLLPGKDKFPNEVRSSAAAFKALFAKIEAALDREKIFITVK